MSELKQNAPHGGEARRPLIYIVDDEPLLSDLAKASLESEQYEVKQFQDPELALKSFQEASRKPDLLLTDYAMGKLNGLELIQKCKEIKPDLKTILTSGTASAEILRNTPVRVERFLPKPYRGATLLQLARSVLSGTD